MITRNEAMGEGKRPQSVDLIDSNMIEGIDKLAKKSGDSRRQFVNDQLNLLIKKEAFLEKYFPNVKKLHFTEGRLLLWDEDIRRDIVIGMEKGLPFCNNCNTNDCLHVLYSMACSELPNLENNQPIRKIVRVIDFDIFKHSIELKVKDEKKSVILEVEPNSDGNILVCDHCANINCEYRNYVLEHKEFWDFLKANNCKPRRVRKNQD